MGWLAKAKAATWLVTSMKGGDGGVRPTLIVVVFKVEVGTGNLALMIFQSQCIGVPNVISEESVGPVPAVRRATNLPRAR